MPSASEVQVGLFIPTWGNKYSIANTTFTTTTNNKKKKLKQQEKQNDHHDTNLVASRKKQLSKTTLIANATLFFIGMVLIRLTTSILHIFKLIFNVFLLLQVVALDHYSLTAYSYSINLSIFNAFHFFKLPELNIYM